MEKLFTAALLALLTAKSSAGKQAFSLIFQINRDKSEIYNFIISLPHTLRDIPLVVQKDSIRFPIRYWSPSNV